MLTRILSCMAVAVVLAGCSSNPPSTPAAKQSLDDDAHAALTSMKAADPSLQQLLDNSYAYAIFPSVGAGGAIIGGAYGRGVVYENGRFSGYADVSQASIGAELGGQTYAELVVFHDRNAFWRLESGKLTFGDEASAVAIKSGVAAGTPFAGGMVTFMQPRGGLMVNASLNGQQFSYTPMPEAQASVR